MVGFGCAATESVRDTMSPDPYPLHPRTSTLEFDGRVPRRVLMISIDTLRKDRLARYGGPAMPWLVDLASQGVVLDDHLTCSNWTYMGTTCTLLGLNHEDVGFLPKIDRSVRVPFPDEPVFLAEVLQDAGWSTELFSANGWLSSDWNTVQGYGDGVVERTNVPAAELLASGLAQVQDWSANGQEQWFLHLHVTEPHAPYDPPEEYLDALDALEPIPYDLTTSESTYDIAVDQWASLPPEERELVEAHLRARYDAELQWLDDMLEDGVEAFRSAGFLDDTLVVVWSDHGEALYDHGAFSHAHHLYGEENDGVAVLWSDTLEPAAWTGPTDAIDLAPTVLDVLGVAIPESMTGLPLGMAPEDRQRFSLTLGRDGGQSALVEGSLKLLFRWPTGDLELYDRSVDPGETDDLYAPDDPRAAALWAALRPHVERASAEAPEQSLIWPEDGL